MVGVVSPNGRRRRNRGRRTLLGREPTSFLNEVSEGGRSSFERTISFEMLDGDIRLARDVSGHFSRLLVLEQCKEGRGGSYPSEGCFICPLAGDAYQSRGSSRGHGPPE